MSRFATPFLAINLGAEMIFVVAQRLQAQGVDHDRSTLVLDEIISVLVSQQLINELVKPQAAYSHQAMKDLIEDVTQSSMMRLDSKSMDKLWDLITMVFKWQLTLSEDLLKLTQRHLYEIENYVTHEATQLQLHKVQNVFDNFVKVLSTHELDELRETMLDWLKDFHVRVSLLLRIGLQSNDGMFVIDGLSPFAEDMLRNLGENIYSVTQNGKLLREEDDEREPNAERGEEAEANRNEALEFEMLAGELKGTRDPRKTGGNGSSIGITNNVLKLSINPTHNQTASRFDNIATVVGDSKSTNNHHSNNNNNSNKNNNNSVTLEDLFEDFRVTTTTTDIEGGNLSLNEDLINMIEHGAH